EFDTFEERQIEPKDASDLPKNLGEVPFSSAIKEKRVGVPQIGRETLPPSLEVSESNPVKLTSTEDEEDDTEGHESDNDDSRFTSVEEDKGIPQTPKIKGAAQL
ncbi:hypothetical protein U1Q18_027553, partial [Sarracenia purpurea var. burkii]